MNARKVGAAILLLGALLLAACAPAVSTVAPRAASETAPAPPAQETCLIEAQLSAGQAGLAALRSQPSFCFELLSGESVVIDQQAALAEVGALLGAPSPELTFEGIGTSLNAPDPLRVADFRDSQNSTFRLDLNTWRVVEAQLQPAIAGAALALPELRDQAAALVAANTPDFAVMQERLTYEEGSKLDMYFFRWEDRTYQGWQAMPPFAQLGLSSDGRLVTYINSLFTARP